MPTTADEAAAAHEQPLPALSKGGGGGGFHYVVVGAGLSGAVLAREAAEAGRKALVIDKREHIAGNCYDYIDHNDETNQPTKPKTKQTNEKTNE